MEKFVYVYSIMLIGISLGGKGFHKKPDFWFSYIEKNFFNYYKNPVIDLSDFFKTKYFFMRSKLVHFWEWNAEDRL